jgi:hypothetical protein
VEAARRIVSALLEANPDEVDPRAYVKGVRSWMKRIEGPGNLPTFSVYDTTHGHLIGHVGYDDHADAPSPQAYENWKDYKWYGYPRHGGEIRFFKTRDEAQRYVEKRTGTG